MSNFNEDNYIPNNEQIQLNENNIHFKSNSIFQDAYHNPLKGKIKTGYKTYNTYSCMESFSNKKLDKNFSNNNLNITPINQEIFQLNNTFPNQKQEENNIYNNIHDDNNNSFNYNIKNNSSNKINDEIVKEYKSLTSDNDEQINELALNIKENENKINQIKNKINKIIQKKTDEDLIDTNNLFSQINDIEKLQQENIILKADSVIFREDISSLIESNNKYNKDLEIARKKIMELIDRNNGLEKEINHKEYQKEKLNEILTRLRLYENQDVEYKIRNNKSKDEVLHEMEYNVKIRKDENKKLIQDKKILEEKIKDLIENKNDNYRNNIINNEKENKIINNLEEKVQILEKGIKDLNDENNMLNIQNTKMEKELEKLCSVKDNHETKYNKMKDEFEKLQYNYNNLYNKYQRMLIESNRILAKRKMLKKNKSEKSLKNNKIAINELYNKIQILRAKVKSERNMENYLIPND